MKRSDLFKATPTQAEPFQCHNFSLLPAPATNCTECNILAVTKLELLQNLILVETDSNVGGSSSKIS